MKRNIYERILYYFSAPTCLKCDERLGIDEFGLCKSCRVLYHESKERKCSACTKSLSLCTCVNEYLDRHYIHKLFKLFRYNNSGYDGEKDASNELIFRLKRDYRRDVVKLLAHDLSEIIRNSGLNFKDFCITNVPRSKSRVNKYGHDHSRVLAKAISLELDIPYCSILKSLAKEAQKKMHGEERIQNANFDYRKENYELKCKNVLLVDDIVTTGASMGSCAMLLRGLGAKKIVGVCVSVAFLDKYKPFASNFKNK